MSVSLLASRLATSDTQCLLKSILLFSNFSVARQLISKCEAWQTSGCLFMLVNDEFRTTDGQCCTVYSHTWQKTFDNLTKSQIFAYSLCREYLTVKRKLNLKVCYFDKTSKRKKPPLLICMKFRC